MRAEQVLARLDELQRPIRAALREAGPLLDGQDASRFKALSLLRWQLLRLIAAYRHFTYDHILDPLIAQASDGAAGAQDLKAKCETLSAELDAHVRRWSLQAPVQDWPGYRQHSRQLRQRIEERLAEERIALSDLLADRARP